MISPTISAAVALDHVSIQHKIDFSPVEARRFAARCESHGVENWRLRRMIREIDKLIPPMYYPSRYVSPPNPNHGRPHHRYTLGKEYSRVVYLHIVKAHLGNQPPYQFRPEFDYNALTSALYDIASRYGADEFDVVENSDTAYTVRVWWD